jgi:hypothetical protein
MGGQSVIDALWYAVSSAGTKVVIGKSSSGEGAGGGVVFSAYEY